MLILNLEQFVLRRVAHMANKYAVVSKAESEAYVAKKRATYQCDRVCAEMASNFSLYYDSLLVYENANNQVEHVLTLLTQDLQEIYDDAIQYTGFLMGAIKDGKDFDVKKYLFGKNERNGQLSQLWRHIHLIEMEHQLDKEKLVENYPDELLVAMKNYDDATARLSAIDKEHERLRTRKNILRTELKVMQNTYGTISAVVQKKLLEDEIKNNFRQKKSLKGFVGKLLSLRQGSDLIP